jgi:hypothetical protein
MLVSTMFAQMDSDVRRGYRLHITNLEDQAFTYTVRYYVTAPNNETGWAARLSQFFRSYVGLHEAIDSMDAPSFKLVGSVYVAAVSFGVEPKQTMSVGIYPGDSSPMVEGLHFVEGYVTLELPVVRDGRSDMAFRSVPQAPDTVRVLLNPETTMIRKDMSGGGYTRTQDGVVTGRVSIGHLYFDIVEPIVPASGKAENELTPNGLVLLSKDALLEAVQSRRAIEAGNSVGAGNMPAADSMGMLIELLCMLDSHEEFLGELNKVLSQNLSAVKICENKS